MLKRNFKYSPGRLLLSILFFTMAVSCSPTIYSLSNPPSGYVFTNQAGQEIFNAEPGTPIQLRSADKKKTILQFTITDNVNFEHVILAQSPFSTALSFTTASDRAGVSEEVSIFAPCNPMQTAVRICPNMADAAKVNNACENEILLTQAAPSVSGYTWKNTDRSDVEMCEVQMNSAALKLGVSGTLALPYYFAFDTEPGYMGSIPRYVMHCQAPRVTIANIRLVSRVQSLNIKPFPDGLKNAHLVGTIRSDSPPDSLYKYIPDLFNFEWFFRENNIFTIDLYGFNFLLPGQQLTLLTCDFKFEKPDAPGGTVNINFNGDSGLAYTVTGFDTDNVYFLDPLDLKTAIAGLDAGEKGTDVLVITDKADYAFTLGKLEFENVKGFEVIDLNNRASNEITLDKGSLLKFSDSNELKILGTELDKIHLSDFASWKLDSEVIFYNGSVLQKYQNGNAILLVQTGITVD